MTRGIETSVNGAASVSPSLRGLWKATQPWREGEKVYALVKALYPICRSITGNGVRQSLRLLSEAIPLEMREIPTGTQVFDWTVPKEWNIKDAYVMNEAGERVIDFHRSNLHVLNYSIPVQEKLSLERLRPHLFTRPEKPEWIPYRTSYYHENWGFCLSHHQLERLEEGEYTVCIDSTLERGYLTYGEFRLQGQIDNEVLISCHCCHPSLCNDNLSGMAVSACLASLLQQVPLRYSYRFLWIPGTIGSITWLALNETKLPRITHGLVLSCIGDNGKFTYKRTRQGDTEIDRAVEHVLRQSGHQFEVMDFTPCGYDERQYGSPGIDLPVGCFMRTPNGCYPQYHTSADDLSFVTAVSLGESLAQLLSVVLVLEENGRFLNLNPKCEPQLGRRGLYGEIGGAMSTAERETAMLWVLNFSDGRHSLLDIASRAGIPFHQMSQAARALQGAGLLEPLYEESVDTPPGFPSRNASSEGPKTVPERLKKS